MKRLGKFKTLAFASLAAVAVAAPLAVAQDGGDGGQEKQRGERGFGKRGGHRGHRGGGFGFRGVDLTEEQQARLKSIHDSFAERTKSLHQQLRAKREELRQAEQGTTFNESFAAQKLTEAASIEARLMAERFRVRQESLSVLTAEQRQQIEQRRQEHEQRREQRRGRRGGDARPGGVNL